MSDKSPAHVPPGTIPPGKPTTTASKVMETGTDMLQAMQPIKHIGQHVCTFALYAHDLSRQIKTHHFPSRLNQDFLQCPVYDSDDRLIGVEYVVSDRIFNSLDKHEQKLWHSHAYEIKSGLWVNPRVPEMLAKPELKSLIRTYGKFWCTWQTDRGDTLPMGPPALMMSPQGVNLGMVRPDLLASRDSALSVSTEDIKAARVDLDDHQRSFDPSTHADYWKNHGKGFAVDAVETDFKPPHVSLAP